MSKRLPYEDVFRSQLSELPLPNEERAWQQMKKLLEDEDDDRGLPLLFLRGCLGSGLLLLALLVGLWLVFRPAIFGHRSEEQKAEREKPAPIETGTARAPAFPATSPSAPAHEEPQDKERRHTQEQTQDPTAPQASIRIKELHAGMASSSDPSLRHKKILAKSGRQTERPAIVQQQSRGRFNAGKTSSALNTSTGDKRDPPVDSSALKTSSTGVNSTAPHTDSTSQLVKAKPPATSGDSTHAKAKKTALKNKNYFSAGIGLQQQIPLAGQKATPYNYYGRKFSLADYLPSVYMRWHHDDRWFLQMEFRYGAPQSVKELPYVQQKFTDTFGTVSYSNTATTRLKKTFYHQLPVSFNYHVSQQFSVGTGLVYSRFHGAITEQELDVRNNQTLRDSVAYKKIVRVRPNSDSFFTRSQVQLLLQTEFQWQRFAAGLRYTKGLQPFIRYTDPSGRPRSETNQSLQFYIRYRLWKSRKWMMNEE